MDPIINSITMKAKKSQFTISKFSGEHVSTSASIESLLYANCTRTMGTEMKGTTKGRSNFEKYNVEPARKTDKRS